MLTRIAAVTNVPVPEAPQPAAEVDAAYRPKAEKRIQKPTGAEHITALQRQLSALAPSVLVEVSTEMTHLNADLRVADQQF